MRAALLAPLAWLVSASQPCAGEWFVDDDGGPGVDFTDVQPAVDAASSGDVVHVAPGLYSGFTLTKPLTIVGTLTVYPIVPSTVAGPVLVSAVPAGTTALLVDLVLDAGLRLGDSAGTLVAENLSVRAEAGKPALSVHDCDDVRVYRSDFSDLYFLTAPPVVEAMRIRTSRVELVQADVDGRDGDTLGVPGGTALLADAGAEVFVTLCEVHGGNGKDPQCSKFMPLEGGDGGDAIHVLGGASVTITGLAVPSLSDHPLIVGGWGGGCEGWCELLGEPGLALRIEAGGFVRHSGTPLGGGDTLSCFDPPAVHVEPGGMFLQPVPIDPSFYAQNLSATAKFELRAEPGALTWWALGPAPQTQPLAGILRDLLIVPIAVVPFGQVPASGALTFETSAPMALPPGTLLYLQVLTVDTAGPALSNSNFLYVR